MAKDACANCPHREKCKAVKQAKSYVVFVSSTKVERAKTIKDKALSPEEYAELRNARNGVESIPSVMRRFYNIDEMPVFGRLKSKLYFSCKIGAYNFKKLMKHVKRTGKSCKPIYPQAQ